MTKTKKLLIWAAAWFIGLLVFGTTWILLGDLCIIPLAISLGIGILGIIVMPMPRLIR